MKNKKIIYWILIIISIIGIIILIGNNHKKIQQEPLKSFNIEKNESNKTIGINIDTIKNEYQNEEIIGYIEIPNVVSYPVLQSNNNDYYINHDINKKSNIKGSIFMDYRVSFNDRKILIYGHSGKEQDLPFLQLNKYSDEEFFNNNSNIYLYSKDKIYVYEIFSAYIETEDYDYVNINSFNGLNWLEHILKLKNKSTHTKDVTLTKNTKILILQTCSMDQNIQSNGGKYQLIIGKLISVEENKYE